ncbi:MAG TPA: endonuclease/exonuclease/phosphatase family protein [Chthoniobacterales bacterium]|jgi:endonuclease/exonuclease/phosphatase family metal-dependent hydrolase
MRFVLLALWLFSISSTIAAPLTVVTWNTKWLPGGKPNATAEAQATQMKVAQEVVKKLNPDILFLQEVRDYKAAEELCSVVPGLTVAAASNFSGRPQNCIIASKLPADSGWYALWKPSLGADNPPRGYAFAAFKLPSSGLLLTYSVHMKSNLGGIERNIAAREESAKQLLEHAKEMMRLYWPRGGKRIIIAGDFNADIGGPRFGKDRSVESLQKAGLQWVWKGVSPSARVTIPGNGKYPADCFDHMLFSGLKLASVSVVKAVPPSDHNAVLATFNP